MPLSATYRVGAVVPVHFHGQLAPVEELRAVLYDSEVIVEDAAQSQAPSAEGHRSCAFSLFAAMDSWPGKNLGAYSDIGCITTSTAEIADGIRAMRNHGGIDKYEHRVVGVSSRRYGIQAVMLSMKLEQLNARNAERRQASARYHELLRDQDVVRRHTANEPESHLWHLYVARVPDRNGVLAELDQREIGAENTMTLQAQPSGRGF